MQNIIEHYRSTIVQLATPYSMGVGFAVPDARVIAAPFSAVQGNREVAVEGETLPPQLASVVFTDPLHDLALLALPQSITLPHVQLSGNEAAVGETVIAIGKVAGGTPTAKVGKVLSCDYSRAGLSYIRHDAAFGTGDAGGPLVNLQGEVIGMNTRFGGEEAGFALPVRHLVDLLAIWKSGGHKMGTRCGHCTMSIFEGMAKAGNICPGCGAALQMPQNEPLYEPKGISRTREAILEECGHGARLARRGPNVWEVRNGSADIFISYYEPNGLIAGDAVLCELSAERTNFVYEYLLRQNHELENLSFSVRGQDAVLSLVIYDRYLSLGTGMKLFRDLFAKADHYDNILVEQFGAKWKRPDLNQG